jgi:hypothetical protein
MQARREEGEPLGHVVVGNALQGEEDVIEERDAQRDRGERDQRAETDSSPHGGAILSHGMMGA